MPISTSAGQQILNREIKRIGQFSEHETKLRDDRDAGLKRDIVDIEITSLVAAEGSQQFQRLRRQPGIAEGGMGVGIEGDRGFKHFISLQSREKS